MFIFYYVFNFIIRLLNSIYNLLKICLGIFVVNFFNDIAVNLMAPYLIFDVFKVIYVFY